MDGARTITNAKINKTGIFVRVSTNDQHTENQKLELNKLVATRDYNLVKLYEYKTSGHHLKIDYLNEILEDARVGNINTLVFWSLDRISRRGSEHLLTTLRRLSEYNCHLVSLQESWLETMSDYNMRAVFISFIGYMSQLESIRRSERIKVAHKRMIKEGRTLGRPPGSKDKKTRSKFGYFGNVNKKKNRGD